MAEGNGQDKALARHNALRALARLPAKQRLDGLIDAPNSKDLVRATPAQDLYYAIAEVGLSDATDIVQLASPHQFRTFVDLGGWKRDRIDPHQVLTWIRAARGDEAEDLYAKLDGIDLEVLEFMLRSFITLHDLEENPDVNPEGVTFETPEGRYLIEFHVEGVELAAMRSLVQDLLARHPFEAVRMLEATRWELPSELEETAFRFRSARLEDLGFPALDQAAALFAYRDPDKVQWKRPHRAGADADGAGLAATKQRVDYLGAALRALGDDEREIFEQELRSVANAALVGEVQDPGDLDAVRRVGEQSRDYLSLALEHLTQGDPTLAVECVRDLDARTLFQVGFSLTLKLKFRVDRLAKEPLALIGGAWLALFELPEALSALRRKRPFRTLKVEGAEPVPFRTRRELDESARLIDRALAHHSLLSALLGGTPQSASEKLARFGKPLEVLGADALFATAIAWAALEGRAHLGPIPSARAGGVFTALFEGTREAPALKSAAVARVMDTLLPLVDEPHRAEIRSAVDTILERLRAEAAPGWLAEGTVDAAVSELLPIDGTQGL